MKAMIRRFLKKVFEQDLKRFERDFVQNFIGEWQKTGYSSSTICDWEKRIPHEYHALVRDIIREKNEQCFIAQKSLR